MSKPIPGGTDKGKPISTTGREKLQIPGKPPSWKSRLGKSLLGGKAAGKSKRKGLFGSEKKKKPSLAQRFKGKIAGKARRIKKKISNSSIGKTYRAIVKTVKFVVAAVKRTAKLIAKTAVVAYTVAKVMVKSFFKAAKATGKAV